MIIKYINEKEQKLNLKEIDINNFNSLSQIYSFTTENIAGYFEYLDFTNKNILTVAASGDHIINAFYKGAKQVYGFDINYLAWYHFILKYTAIKVLSYEEFMQMFVSDNLDNLSIYAKLRKYLPDEVKYFFDKLISLGRTFSSIKIKL